ncbi:MAG: hypothetical protein HY040_20655 [Planctomycetes bacterium]|nr:hypothetical protein [Planctomycetota bacterium]
MILLEAANGFTQVFRPQGGQIDWWRMERWLLPRIERAEVFERLARHHLVHPIRHGARVSLPRAALEQQMLFDEWDDG